MSAEPDWQLLRRLADMHAVYRMFDAEGRLLYVGMTGDAGRRLGDHFAKRWFPLVANIALEWHPTRAAARLAEVRAIQGERPRYNRADRTGTPKEPVAARPIHRPWKRQRGVPHEVKAVLPPQPPLPGRVTLREASCDGGRGVVSLSLVALRKASQRDGFPARRGHRGLAGEWDAVELAEWEATRR